MKYIYIIIVSLIYSYDTYCQDTVINFHYKELTIFDYRVINDSGQQLYAKLDDAGRICVLNFKFKRRVIKVLFFDPQNYSLLEKGKFYLNKTVDTVTIHSYDNDGIEHCKKQLRYYAIRNGKWYYYTNRGDLIKIIKYKNNEIRRIKKARPKNPAD